MALSVDYVIKETSTNIWRNRMVALAAMLTVALSLTFVGGALLFKQGVAKATARWEGGVQLVVFMETTSTPSESHAILSQMVGPNIPSVGSKPVAPGSGGMPQVKSVWHCDQACTYKEFKTLNSDDPTITAVTKPSDLPQSYRVQLQNGNQAPSVARLLNHQPGVQDVVYPSKAVSDLLRLSKFLQGVSFLIAFVLLVAAIVLILNAIRLAIFARRKEVSVMKLVGATNWFIQVPFMLEGLFQGVVGSLLAWGAMALGTSKFESLSNNNPFALTQALTISSHDVFTTGLLVVLLGAAIGAGGSAVAVRRFLDV